MSRHTPGPWEMSVVHFGEGFYIFAPNTPGPTLAHVRWAIPDTEANAHLIAAAPELLDSLRELHNWMREHASVGESLEMLTRSHNALAKAEQK